MKNTQTHPGASKWAEVEDLKAAGERLVQRAQKDKRVAQRFLHDIGYYQAMEQANAHNGGAPAPLPKAAPAKRRAARIKPIEAKE